MPSFFLNNISLLKFVVTMGSLFSCETIRMNLKKPLLFSILNMEILNDSFFSDFNDKVSRLWKTKSYPSYSLEIKNYLRTKELKHRKQ
jgi:hypothetical protein